MYDRLCGWLASQTWPDLQDRVMSDPERICYGHPYGFVVVRLVGAVFPGWQIRVHLWPGVQEYGQRLSSNGTINQQVHCHGFEVLSKVVIGCIEEKSHVLEPGKGGVYEVSSDIGAGKSELRRCALGVDAVEQQTRMRNGSGDDVYYIPQGQFHSSAPAFGASVTVVATSTDSGSPSYVWSKDDLGKVAMNRRSTVADSYLNRLMGDYEDMYGLRHRRDDRWGSFVLLTDVQRRVLLLKSARRPEIWQPAGGRGEAQDASVEATALREVREETGLELSRVALRELATLKRDVGEGDVHFWWASVDESDSIQLQSGEILTAQWFSMSEAVDLPLYPATRRAIQTLQRRWASDV